MGKARAAAEGRGEVIRTLLAFLALFAAAAPVHAKAAPARDWSKTVTVTAKGGFRSGNPAAKVALIEYGSMTCPHCRAFDQTGASPLINLYVKTGKVSYEFRNYVRDALDMSAALVARCGGPRSFFAVTRALYDDQPKWIEKVQKAPKAVFEQTMSLPKERMFAGLARLGGLQPYATAKGVSPAQTARCLADKAAIARLADMAGQAKVDFPDFQGTPTFILNGRQLEDVGAWDTLQPAITAALGR